MVVTYVVPISRAGAVVVGALNVVALVCLLTAVGLIVVESRAQFSAGSWATWAVIAVTAVGIFACTRGQVRRRCYLVLRPSLLAPPAGGYRVRTRHERR